MKHPKPERLSAFLEGELTLEEGRELERHVDGCERCGRLLSDFRDIQRLARGLPERQPPRDLWPAIAAAMEEGKAREPDIIKLFPGTDSGTRKRRRTLRLSLPQAAAAGLVLAVFSGALGARLGPGEASVPDPVSEVPASWVSLVSMASPELEGPAQEVARLEEIFTRHREDLDPGTAKVLEKNLGVIDRAIRESIQALEDDPGNRFLENHLERAVLAKGEFLRDAALLLNPRT